MAVFTPADVLRIARANGPPLDWTPPPIADPVVAESFRPPHAELHDDQALAGMWNAAFSRALAAGRWDESTTKPSELRGELTDFAGAINKLLDWMSLDKDGQPLPTADGFPIRSDLTDWFDLLRQGFDGLADASFAANSTPDAKLAADTRIAKLYFLAGKVVPLSIAVDAAESFRVRRAAMGLPVSDGDARFVSEIAAVEAAMTCAGPLLAMLAGLAEASAERQRPKSKSNFHRSFLAVLFQELTQVFRETFGRFPSQAGDDPGGSSVRWFAAVLQHAKESAALPKDAQKAVGSVANNHDTLYPRIRAGVKACAKSRANADDSIA